jgi:hypothetical protein
MPNSTRSTHIRVPSDLAARLERLREQMQTAYSEGRISVPTEHCEHIPLWYVIQTLCDEVEARKVRSNRPRTKTSSQPQHQEFLP